MDWPKKEYVGDAVYVDFDGWNVVLTTEDGIRTTNVIYLEPELLTSLEAYFAKVKKAFEEGRKLHEAVDKEGSGPRSGDAPEDLRKRV